MITKSMVLFNLIEKHEKKKLKDILSHAQSDSTVNQL